jgi:hypothetical protein
MKIVLRHDSRWEDKGTRTAAALSEIEVPTEIALTALANNNALEPGSEVVRRLRESFGVAYHVPRPEACIDLAGPPPVFKPRYFDRGGRDVTDELNAPVATIGARARPTPRPRRDDEKRRPTV